MNEKTKRLSPTQILKEQLAEAQRSEQYWRGKYDAVSKELDENFKKERDTFGMSNHRYEEQSRELIDMNRQMMEIVRWHVNPETAKVKPPTNCGRCGAPFGQCHHTGGML